jgi:uncharacterized protein
VNATAPTVLVFLKAPRFGYVKTRLAGTLGSAAANAVYRELTERQMAEIPAHWRLEVHYAPRGARPEMRPWLGKRPRYRLQRGEGLGARLTNAFGAAFAAGASRVFAIGADCPDLDAASMRLASQALNATDVVLGPAKDGGYYLIGLRRHLPSLFAEIPWSSDEVLRTTLRRARALGASIHLLEEREDIDDAAALRRYRLRQASGPRHDRRAST